MSASIRRHWLSREDKALQKGLQSPTMQLPEIIRRFLHARGVIAEQQIENLLEPKINNLRNPFDILNMNIGAERLVEAFRKNEKICVYADFDLDGTSGLALLWEGLEKLGFNNIIGYQPLRLSEGYGFHSHVVEDLFQQGIKVIITVDVGITAIDACIKAKELGIDVIITDHHLPASKLPEAYAVINPNQNADSSNLGYLCGAGVAFYFLRAMKRHMVDAGLCADSDLNLTTLLDFFTIATLTDMVPLVEDNRPLVRLGLQILSQTKRPGLVSLLENLNLYGKNLNSQDVAIKFAPKLNALSRMESGLRPIDIFRVQDLNQAEEMVSGILENNETRASLQAQGEKLAFSMLNNEKNKSSFVVSSEFHRGVVGLIATKLANQTNTPSFVGAVNTDGLVVGSARLPAGSDLSLLDILNSASDLFNRFGGHASAAGFEFSFDNFDKIKERIELYISELDQVSELPPIEYDLDVELQDLTAASMQSLEKLGPYGQGFAVPLFRIQNILPSEIKVLKGGHLKFMLTKNDQKLEALYFSPPQKVVDSLSKGENKIEILAELQWNDFAGKRRLQLNIRELKSSTINGFLS